jgi:hypothetical protein
LARDLESDHDLIQNHIIENAHVRMRAQAVGHPSRVPAATLDHIADAG